MLNSIKNGAPCIEYGCHVCCVDTKMPLSHEDIERLKSNGLSDFMIETKEEIRLRNVDGKCVFLHDGRCTAYEVRPEGCRLYPLLLRTVDNMVGIDGDCPHSDAFDYSEKDVQELLTHLNRIKKP